MITQELDFYSHVNYSVTKIEPELLNGFTAFYSHVNYSVTKIIQRQEPRKHIFYSHVNYSVTKIRRSKRPGTGTLLQSRKLFSY